MSTGLTRVPQVTDATLSQTKPDPCVCSQDERVVSDENDGAREEPGDAYLVIMTGPEPGFPSTKKKK